jgi:prenyl protein peptidase
VILLRNLVVAPVTEEVVFRGLMVPALLSSCCCLGGGGGGDSMGGAEAARFVSLRAPLFFGVAHLHHVVEKLWVSKEPPLRVLASTLAQLTYTSIFGAIACYLFVRTGNIASPLLSHVICNFAGLPDLSFLEERGSPLAALWPRRHALLALHALGLAAFWLLLDPLTSSAQCAGLSPFWIIQE